MTNNRWASPEGFADGEVPTVRYRIRDARSGEIVERTTQHLRDSGMGRHYLSLRDQDQDFAAAIVALVQRACGYFYLPDGEYVPLEGVPDVVVSDDEVRERIHRLDKGENTREAERTAKRSYPISELPWDQQRALVEQVERLKREWCFELLGEDSDDAVTTGGLPAGLADDLTIGTIGLELTPEMLRRALETPPLLGPFTDGRPL